MAYAWASWGFGWTALTALWEGQEEAAGFVRSCQTAGDGRILVCFCCISWLISPGTAWGALVHTHFLQHGILSTGFKRAMQLKTVSVTTEMRPHRTPGILKASQVAFEEWDNTWRKHLGTHIPPAQQSPWIHSLFSVYFQNPKHFQASKSQMLSEKLVRPAKCFTGLKKQYTGKVFFFFNYFILISSSTKLHVGKKQVSQPWVDLLMGRPARFGFVKLLSNF